MHLCKISLDLLSQHEPLENYNSSKISKYNTAPKAVYQSTVLCSQTFLFASPAFLFPVRACQYVPPGSQPMFLLFIQGHRLFTSLWGLWIPRAEDVRKKRIWQCRSFRPHRCGKAVSKSCIFTRAAMQPQIGLFLFISCSGSLATY